MDGIAHPAFVVTAAEHAGHWCNAQLLNVLARIEMIFDIHDHLRLLAIHGELIGAGDARTIEQRVDGEHRRARFDGFKPE